ncbi:MAG: SET domain-containing protein [Patescibacteria group bacterium]
MNKNVKKLNKIASLVYAQLKPSKIEGVGVFAIRNIPKGVEPFHDVLLWHKKSYSKISKAELKHLPSHLVGLIKIYAVGDNKHYWVSLDSWNKYGIDDFLNHSTKPNVGPKSEYRFVALRDISEGEELTIDYRKIDDEWREKLKKAKN